MGIAIRVSDLRMEAVCVILYVTVVAHCGLVRALVFYTGDQELAENFANHRDWYAVLVTDEWDDRRELPASGRLVDSWGRKRRVGSRMYSP